jgi:hypothetical protein
VPSNDEEMLKEAVATVGPVSVAINARKSLKHYSEGLYSCVIPYKRKHYVMDSRPLKDPDISQRETFTLESVEPTLQL